MPKISIIVPVYKVEKYIHRCIDSILAQTFTDFELILVDDGSPDNCGKICDEYAKKDSRVRVIHKPNGGVSSARNAGIDAARGEYLIFVDSDDEVDADNISEMIVYKEYDLVTTGWLVENKDGVWNTKTFEDEFATTDHIRANFSKYFCRNYFGTPWAKLYKKSIIDSFRLRFPLSIQYGEDTIFNIRYISHCSNVRILPDSKYRYHFYYNSLCHNPNAENWEWIKELFNAINDFCGPMSNSEKDYFNNYKFKTLSYICSRCYPEHKDMIPVIFHDPFWKDVITLIRKHPKNRWDICFIFFTSINCYPVYYHLIKYKHCIGRIVKKILRRDENQQS